MPAAAAAAAVFGRGGRDGLAMVAVLKNYGTRRRVLRLGSDISIVTPPIKNRLRPDLPQGERMVRTKPIYMGTNIDGALLPKRRLRWEGSDR